MLLQPTSQPNKQRKKKSQPRIIIFLVCVLINILANGFECFICTIHYDDDDNDDGINAVRRGRKRPEPRE